MPEFTSNNPDPVKQLGTYSLSNTAKKPPGLRRRMPWIKHSRRLMLSVAIVIIGFVGGFAGSWLQSQMEGNDFGDLVGQKKIVTQESKLISQIARNVGPSVVSVNLDIAHDRTELSGYEGGVSSAAGTGIIMDKNYVITNRHVVPEGSTNLSVILSDGTELKDVSVVGRTNEGDTLDIAILKINDTKGRKLKAATLGDSSTTQVGDNVIAIGNALGEFQNSVTAGIISGYGRSVQAGDDSGGVTSFETLVDLIQTDAAINQGNSGGPLVNLNGQVIGINTAIAGDAQNIGFAIPINGLKGLIGYLLETGKFSRPYLGVRYVALTPEVARYYRLDVEKGAYIPISDDPFNSSVASGSPAAKAGLREKDIIVAVNDKKIDQLHSLPGMLGEQQPGEQVELTILRGGKTIELKVALGTMPTN